VIMIMDFMIIDHGIMIMIMKLKALSAQGCEQGLPSLLKACLVCAKTSELDSVPQ
jgi:hypothetical protein